MAEFQPDLNELQEVRRYADWCEAYAKYGRVVEAEWCSRYAFAIAMQVAARNQERTK